MSEISLSFALALFEMLLQLFRYADTVVARRKCILFGFFFLASVLSLTAWLLHSKSISANPREGFETRGTYLSARRLTIATLRSSVATPSELLTLRRFGVRTSWHRISSTEGNLMPSNIVNLTKITTPTLRETDLITPTTIIEAMTSTNHVLINENMTKSGNTNSWRNSSTENELERIVVNGVVRLKPRHQSGNSDNAQFRSTSTEFSVGQRIVVLSKEAIKNNTTQDEYSRSERDNPVRISDDVFFVRKERNYADINRSKLSDPLEDEQKISATVFFTNLNTKRSANFSDKNGSVNETGEKEVLNTTVDALTINYDDYGLGYELQAEDLRSSPCAQFLSFGTFIPYESLHQYVKIVVEAESIGELLSAKTLRSLCEIDALPDLAAHKSGFLNYSLNLPYYAMCLSESFTTTNCREITTEISQGFYRDVRRCFSLTPSDSIDPFCDSSIMEQLHHLVFSRDFHANTSNPIHIAITLKMPNYGRRTKSDENIDKNNFPSFDAYDQLRIALTSVLTDANLRLIGFYAGDAFRDAAFERAVWADALVCVSTSAVLVAVVLWVFSGSALYTFIVVVTIPLSLGVAFFAYTVLFGIEFFPFVAIVAVLIAIAVGADGALFLAHVHRRNKSELRRNAERALNINALYSMPPDGTAMPVGSLQFFYAFNAPVYQHSMRNNAELLSLRLCLRYFVPTIFVTCLTTSATFFTNLASKIMVLKCFGLFAALTTLVLLASNFTVVPAALSLSDDVICRPIARFVIVFSALKPLLWTQQFRIKFAYFCVCRVPMLVARFRIIINTLALVSTIIGALYLRVAAFSDPLSVLHTELLRYSHPSEWYAARHKCEFNFSFSESSYNPLHYDSLYIRLYAIWGFKVLNDSSEYNPTRRGTLHYDNAFYLSGVDDIEKLAREVAIVGRTLIQLTSPKTTQNTTEMIENDLWLSQFVAWTRQLGKEDKDCGNVSNSMNNTANHRIYNTGDCFRRYFLENGRLSTMSGLLPSMAMSMFDSPLFLSNRLHFNRDNVRSHTDEYADVENALGDATPFRGYFLAVSSIVETNTLPILAERLQRIESQLATILRYPPTFITLDEEAALAYDLRQAVGIELPLGVALSLGVCAAIMLVVTRCWRLTICVCAAILYALIHTFVCLHAAGWRIGVVEATLVITAIGLSFDYMLHYASAYQNAPNTVSVQKLSHANAESSNPIFAAALINFGIAALLTCVASTQPVLRVGQLLAALSASAIVATFIVLAALLLSLA